MKRAKPDGCVSLVHDQGETVHSRLTAEMSPSCLLDPRAWAERRESGCGKNQAENGIEVI